MFYAWTTDQILSTWALWGHEKFAQCQWLPLQDPKWLSMTCQIKDSIGPSGRWVLILIVAWWHHMASEIWVNFGSGNGSLPDGTKPLPEPMLTNDQRGVVAFTWWEFHRKHLRYLSLKWVWNFLIWDCSQIPGANELKLMRQTELHSTDNFIEWIFAALHPMNYAEGETKQMLSQSHDELKDPMRTTGLKQPFTAESLIAWSGHVTGCYCCEKANPQPER